MVLLAESFRRSEESEVVVSCKMCTTEDRLGRCEDIGDIAYGMQYDGVEYRLSGK